MSAATIHTATQPVVVRATQPATRPTLPGQRTAPPRLRLVPDPAPVTTALEPAELADHGLQLTPRGRLVLMLALVAAGAVLAFMISGLVGGGSPGTAPAQPQTQTRTVVVQPGQTLWSIARDIAPGADRRATIARIVQLNRLPSTDVAAGTRLAIPTR